MTKRPLKLITSFILHFSILYVLGQSTKLPYYNNFDNASDTLNWKHYAINGTDDWELGTPDKNNFKSAYSNPKAWVTYLTNNYAENSRRALETPYFNLKDTSKNYVLSFYQKRQINAANLTLEYTTDNGKTWLILENSKSKKKNWQTSGGFYNDVYSHFEHSALNIKFLTGKDSVKFRFNFLSSVTYGAGWMIDNFVIAPEYYNFYATQADTVHVSKHCTDFKIITDLGLDNQYSDFIVSTTNYYFSKDAILDSKDTLVKTYTIALTETFSNMPVTINLLPNLKAGRYYIIYKHDSNNVLKENNETDNTGYAVLIVDSVFNAPYVENFDGKNQQWKAYPEFKFQSPVWQLGKGYRHHIEGTHSGTKAWHTSASIDFNPYNCGSNCNVQYAESPYLDLTAVQNDLALNFWYKNNIDANAYSLEYSKDCGTSWTYLLTLPPNREDEWDIINDSIPYLSSEDNIKFRIKSSSSYLGPEGIIFDDIYIGEAKPDLSIERENLNLFTVNSISRDTLRYFLNNCGIRAAVASTTSFYWSADSIFDKTDIFLGVNQEQGLNPLERIWKQFVYTKPNQTINKYYIFYFLDTANDVNEMREYNNTGLIAIYQETAKTIPYFNDFETQINGWRHNTSLGKDDWQWTTPKGKILNTAFSGSNVWITKDTGLVSPLSRMHLYTPVFDLSNTTNPVLEFDMKSITWGGSITYGQSGGNISYSVNGGTSWKVLDTTNMSFKSMYYSMKYDAGKDNLYYLSNYTQTLFDEYENSFVTPYQYQSRDTKNNTRFIIDLNYLKTSSAIQFRYNFGSVKSESEGILLDNFRIREAFTDLNVDYKKALMISSKANKIKFFMQIKNQGNYMTKPGIAKFYLSIDTIINGSDYYLGQSDITEVRPDFYYYLNTYFNAPSNLISYKYLLYELDVDNSNIEIDELNNKGYWHLALDSIKTYPYLNDFNDSIIDGWHQYSTGPYHTNIGDYRFRNMISPAEALYQTKAKSGEMFTDRMLNGSWNTPPYMYLESPVFDFSGTDNLLLTFNLLCTGGSDGGNLHFSTDGGNTWKLLTSGYGISYNWYNNFSPLVDLDNEPGWNGLGGCFNDKLDSLAFDISFLKGEKNVVFLFKYKSNVEVCGSGTVQGMRLDNFKITSNQLPNYFANKKHEIINVKIAQSSFNANYSIINNGVLDGAPSKTAFYWSLDSIFDGNDQEIQIINESKIVFGDTLNSALKITYPTPINQTYYYLFYKTDVNNSILEGNEDDNIGSFKIIFDYTNSLQNKIYDRLKISGSDNDINIYSTDNFDNKLNLAIYNSNGQSIYQSLISINEGINKFQLPENIPSGLYIINLFDNNINLTKKIVLLH